MKNLITLIVALTVSSLGWAQPSDSKVMSYAKNKYPGYQVSNISGQELWHKGERYYWYTFALRHKVDLPGYPGVTEVAQGSVYYWPNGTKKQDGSYIARFYEGLPKPSKAEVQKALDAIDRPAYFGPDYQGYISVDEITIEENFTFKWTSEKKVHIEFGSMTYLTTVPPKSTQRIKREIQISLTREAYNKPWVARVGGTANNIEILEEKKYEGEEWLKVKTSTYAEKFAEENAQKEWDALVPIDIPMESVEGLCVFAHNLFLTGTRDEVKSFLFRTTPSGQFWDNSTVRINYTRREVVNRILRDIFDTPKNYRNEYCQTSVISKRTKKGYSFANHNFTQNSIYDVRQDGDKLCFVDCDMGFSGNGAISEELSDARKFPCRGEMTNLENFEMPEIMATINWPAGGKERDTPPNRLKRFNYWTEFDAAYYSIYATFLDPEKRSNADRFSIAKNTALNVKKDTDGYISSKEKTFKVNEVEGYEIIITYNDVGKIYDECFRFIVLGNVFYEIKVRAPKLRENEMAVLESFTSTLEGGSTSSSSSNTSSNNTSFKVGDYVIITYDWAKSGKDQVRKGVIEEDKGEGMYLVHYYEKGTKQGMPARFLKPDSSGKKPSGSTSNTAVEKKDSYDKKDQVKVNTSSGWKDAVVTKVNSDKTYEVYCPSTKKYYTAPAAALKYNPSGKAKEKKKIPSLNL